MGEWKCYLRKDNKLIMVYDFLCGFETEYHTCKCFVGKETLATDQKVILKISFLLVPSVLRKLG